jgi:hypothetical protein
VGSRQDSPPIAGDSWLQRVTAPMLHRTRILTAVPQTLQTRLEIAKAIQMLIKQGGLQKGGTANAQRHRDLLDEIAEGIWVELQKAGFRPDQPRWPKGSGEQGGRWSGGAGTGSPIPEEAPPPDTTPRSWTIDDGADLPANSPPEIPTEPPQTKSEFWDFTKAAASWLAAAGLGRAFAIGLEGTIGGPVGDFLLAIETAYWLSGYLPYIYSYLDPPKTWEELQQNQGPGYDEHHVVERWSENDGIPSSLIYSSENEVAIPTLKHWEVNGWLDTPSGEFTDSEGYETSPREYLRGKSFEERRRIGILALIKFGVLKP